MDNIDILEEQAINAAVNHQWEYAISLNKEILKHDPVNLGTFLRLAFASMQKYEYTQAKKYYKEALKIQPSNRIAQENLEKVSILEDKKKKYANSANPNLDPNLFLEIPGKTKTVKLVNLGQKEELAGLTIGQEVDLKIKKRRIEVRTKHNEYIGCLPDDVSRRLEFFLRENSVYKSYIKDTNLNDIVIFIKEESKGKKVQQYPSFPQNPNIFMSDIQKSQDDEPNAEDDDEAEEEWVGLGEEVGAEERDEDLENITRAEDEEENDEE